MPRRTSRWNVGLAAHFGSESRGCPPVCGVLSRPRQPVCGLPSTSRVCVGLRVDALGRARWGQNLWVRHGMRSPRSSGAPILSCVSEQSRTCGDVGTEPVRLYITGGFYWINDVCVQRRCVYLRFHTNGAFCDSEPRLSRRDLRHSSRGSLVSQSEDYIQGVLSVVYKIHGAFRTSIKIILMFINN